MAWEPIKNTVSFLAEAWWSQYFSVLMGLLLNKFVFILGKNTRKEPLNTAESTLCDGRTLKDTMARYIFTFQSTIGNNHGSNTRKWFQFLTKANCRPMFPIVITPAKKIQGNQERMYRKSGEVYLCREETYYSNLSYSFSAESWKLILIVCVKSLLFVIESVKTCFCSGVWVRYFW